MWIIKYRVFKKFSWSSYVYKLKFSRSTVFNPPELRQQHSQIVSLSADNSGALLFFQHCDL